MDAKTAAQATGKESYSLDDMSSALQATSDEAWMQMKRHSDALLAREQQQQRERLQLHDGAACNHDLLTAGWRRSSHLHVGNSDDSFSDSDSGCGSEEDAAVQFE